MKRSYSLLIVFMVALLAKAEKAEVGGIIYQLDAASATAAVTSNTNSSGFNYPDISGSVTIPETVTVGNIKYTVTEIGNSAFYTCEGIEAAVLPESITKIGNYAFSECIKLQSISLPAGLSHVGMGAFSSTALKELKLTGDISVIAAKTFAGTELEVITLPSSVKTIEEYAFSGCDKLREIHLGNSITTIGDNAFARCKAMASVEFPATLSSIGKRAFINCQALKKLNLNRVTTIGENAFEKCSALADIDFGSGELSVGYSAFAECPALKSLIIPSNVVKLSQYAFYDCLGLESVRFDDGEATLELGHAPFANDPMTDLYIGRSITTTNINVNVFSSNKNVARLTLGDGVKTIPSRLFSYMQALEEVSFGANVSRVGSDAFASCPQLKTVKCGNIVNWAKTDFEDAYANPLNYGADLYINGQLLTSMVLPEGAGKIGENTFPGYSQLTDIIIPASVRSIGQQAFMDCSSLRKIDFRGSVATIGGRAFRNCTALAEVYSPSLEAWLDNGFETALSSPLSYGAKLYAGDALIEDSCMPTGTNNINDFAFYNYSLITNIVIDESISEIGRSAFQDCSSLKEIELGAGIRQLGKKAFNGAPLATITSRNPLPPTFDTASTTATFSNYNAIVYVPTGSLDAYRSNEYWKNFANIIEKDLSGINGIICSEETPFAIAGNTVSAKTDLTIYSIDGKAIAGIQAHQSIALSDGVYIVRNADKSFKIAIRH